MILTIVLWIPKYVRKKTNIDCELDIFRIRVCRSFDLQCYNQGRHQSQDQEEGILIVLTVILSVRARPNLLDNQTYL